MVDPEVARVPDQAPLAVQEVALEEPQVRVALCPGITEAGVTPMVTVVGAAGGAGVVAGVDPLLQPERTKAKRSKTANKEVAFLDPVGNCMTPPFA